MKTRKWTTSQVAITTISGVPLTIPMWTREGGFSHATTDHGSRRASIDGLAESGETFACDFDGCKKVFDGKDKLRRHQNVHKKKLQLKLPSFKLVQQQQQQQEQQDQSSQADVPSDLPNDETTTSKLESEI